MIYCLFLLVVERNTSKKFKEVYKSLYKYIKVWKYYQISAEVDLDWFWLVNSIFVPKLFFLSYTKYKFIHDGKISIIVNLTLYTIHFCRMLYHPHALVLSEEAHIISGLLVGLNVIDCNLCLKERDLDNLPQVSSHSGGGVVFVNHWGCLVLFGIIWILVAVFFENVNNTIMYA